jgi:hypothetical protein
MTSDHWPQLKELLLQALELPPQNRGAFLDEACGADSAMREEIDALLLEEEFVRSNFLRAPILVDDLGGSAGGARNAAGIPSVPQQ